MRLELITVKNFRNLVDVRVPLLPGAVIVGENGSGKSNLLHALRLVLDPSLPSSERRLRREDFSDALGADQASYDPMASGDEIEISVEFGGIDGDPQTIAMLGASLIEADPMRARLVYRFAPRDTETESGEQRSYVWKILGGPSDAEEEVRGDLRRFLRLNLLSALRDVERDIAYWGRSPLRPLLDAAAAQLDDDALKGVAQSVTEANQRVLDLEPIGKLDQAIVERTHELVGDHHASPTSLGVAPSDPQRLLRTLRLFIDDGARGLGSASLGTLNVIYVALLQLALAQEVDSQEAAHIILGIEEPEAHLHPHVQRLVFADVLRKPEGREQSVIVTTHSPHIVSVTRPESLVVLRAAPNGTEVGIPGNAGLTPAEWDDIDRYLDATRGEMVFARRVLLVEGFAEAVLVPKLAGDAGIDFDKCGVTVCPIHGVHFGVYVRYLTALGTPWAVLTDGDPDDKGRAGDRRAKSLLERLELDGTPNEHGIFVGEVTFEPDLAMTSSANGIAAGAILEHVGWGEKTKALVNEWKDTGVHDAGAYLAVVERFGKARLAQRLAASESTLDSPEYLANALDYLLP